MQEGAFALIDCLGWKGIWRHPAGPEKVLGKIVKIRQRIAEESGQYSDVLSRIKIDARPELVFLSDSVALSVPLIEADDSSLAERRGFTLQVAIKTLIELVDLYVDDVPYLAMRGSLTYGEHIILENTFLGPAIDEVASSYELANGAFVWLDPSAESIYSDFKVAQKLRLKAMMAKANEDLGEGAASRLFKGLEHFSNYPLVIDDYPMPLKDGNNLNCSVINPLATLRLASDRENTIARYEKSFNKSVLDVILKKQNSLKLLSWANRLTADYLSHEIDEELMKTLGKVFGIVPKL